MSNTEKVISDETKGRQLFGSFLQQKGIQYTCTTDQMDSVDMVITNKNGDKIVTEIKTRNPKFESYETFIFEQNKLLGMQQRMKELGAKAGIYVYIFGTHIYIYNIKDIVEQTELTYKWLPANSFGDGRKVQKAIYQFRKDLAFKKVQLDNNNKWIKL